MKIEKVGSPTIRTLTKLRNSDTGKKAAGAVIASRRRSHFAKTAFFLCAAIVLFFGFYDNSWHVVDQTGFSDFQAETEALIIGRIVKSREDGIFSSAGLPGEGSPSAVPFVLWTNSKITTFQYEAFNEGSAFKSYTVYKSEICAQGILFSVLDSVLRASPAKKLRFFQAIVSLAAAVLIAAIMLWFYSEFGLFAAIIVLGTSVSSPWLVLFGRTLWFELWAYYLPVAVVMHFLGSNRLREGTGNYLKFGAVVFVAVFIKCLFNGYEFITTALVMMLVPLVYYGILDQPDLRVFLKHFAVASIAALTAVLCSMVILCFQISAVDGNFMKGVDHIIYSFQKRSHGDPARFQEREYIESLKADTCDVVTSYVHSTFSDFSTRSNGVYKFLNRFVDRVSYSFLIVLFSVMSLLLLIRRGAGKTRQRDLALVGALWFSSLAPLSWFIIFKAHAYVHGFLDPLVWQMPFTLFGFALCGVVIKRLASDAMVPAKQRLRN